MADHTVNNSIEVALVAGVPVVVALTENISSYLRLTSRATNTEDIFYKVAIGVEPQTTLGLDGYRMLEPGTDHIFDDFGSFARRSPTEPKLPDHERDDIYILLVSVSAAASVVVEGF